MQDNGSVRTVINSIETFAGSIVTKQSKVKFKTMIARISILILLLTLLPDLYIYMRYLRQRRDITLWMRLLWWAAMLACTAAYSMMRNFAPNNLTFFNVYLFMIGLLIMPKVIFTLASLAGMAVKRLLKQRKNWGNHTGLVLVLGWLYVLFMGTMVGPDQLHVERVTLEFDTLPQAFDGYRIGQISDMHLGSMKQEFARRIVAQVNELHPDALLFTGDLLNMRPQEAVSFTATLIHLHPVDGIFSVLGNHDYADYVKTATAEQRSEMERLTRSLEGSMNWDLLLNERRILRRGADSIVIAGTENDGRPPFPAKADYQGAAGHIARIVRYNDAARPVGLAPTHSAANQCATYAERTHARRTALVVQLATDKRREHRRCRTLQRGQPLSVCVYRRWRLHTIPFPHEAGDCGNHVKSKRVKSNEISVSYIPTPDSSPLDSYLYRHNKSDGDNRLLIGQRPLLGLLSWQVVGAVHHTHTHIAGEG